MSLHLASGEELPVGRNLYREDTYFKSNVKNGVLRSASGTRLLTIPEDMILGLHRGLTDETGGAAGVILYSIGRWWGKQFVMNHQAEMRRFYQRDLGDLPVALYLQVLRRAWAIYGWGTIEVDFDMQDLGFVEASVDGALYSTSVGNIGRTSDHIVAGVLAAIVSELAGRELEATEIACRSQGDPQCRFLVGLESRVNIVSNWVSQKRSAEDILKAIRDGELV